MPALEVLLPSPSEAPGFRLPPLLAQVLAAQKGEPVLVVPPAPRLPFGAPGREPLAERGEII
jgi:hypothetical protein